MTTVEEFENFKKAVLHFRNVLWNKQKEIEDKNLSYSFARSLAEQGITDLDRFISSRLDITMKLDLESPVMVRESYYLHYAINIDKLLGVEV